MTPITKLLITTALDATWGSQQNIIFLGEWCKKYSMKNLWQSREHETLDYHWRDRSKLAKDHHYLESLNVKLTAKDFFFSSIFFPLYSSNRLTSINILFSSLKANSFIASKLISAFNSIDKSLLEDGNFDSY